MNKINWLKVGSIMAGITSMIMTITKNSQALQMLIISILVYIAGEIQEINEKINS